ncbi:receptor-like protein kinase [Seminavis robusta]|uniref:Receptor-like protein kinase n=1 Tax=Seminavis robusta TaxID=568900 RepID=A0A9N8HVL1_9STRA|nr:receptor-like protein kinase [Seminavis robusta]|eukprot:Sro1964_g308200.1 receptor-like protein kinase (373) ;mRNA; f:9869-11162
MMMRYTLISVALSLLSHSSTCHATELHLRKRELLEDTPTWEAVEQQALQLEYTNVTTTDGVAPFFDQIKECYGDCDTSSDCGEGLFCYHRDLDNPIVPGCTEQDNGHLETTNSVCVSKKYANVVGSSRVSPVRRTLLGRCRGDCDSNRDCDGNLVCHQRGVGDPVPGCSGKSLGTSRDYCVSPGAGGGGGSTGAGGGATVSTGTGGGTTSGSFRLKIYWEQGYDWQDEYVERKWCLVRNYRVGGMCWDGITPTTCRANRVYVTRCGSTSGQSWQFVHVGNGEALIKGSGTNRCLARSGTNIELRTCNNNSPSQRFYTPNGCYNCRRFELSQRTAPGLCLNQDHHPKNSEYVQMMPCWQTRARDSLTSFWEKA